MTIWHTLGSIATAVPGVGSVRGILHRLGITSDGFGGKALIHSEDLATDSVKFTIAIIALSAKLARSDGAVTIDEVEMFRRIMSVPTGEEDNVRRLFDLAKQDVSGFEFYARQIGSLLKDDPTLSREVLDGLFAIAAADGVLHEREDAYLEEVAGHLGYTRAAYVYGRGMFFDAPMGPYDVLGLTPDATDQELRTRHRKLAKEHHPDRLIGRGCAQAFIAQAEQKLARINAAFDVIARERGL